MAAFSQITIVGTGLIGGSFALAVRKHGFKGRIVGCDRGPVLERAVQIGVLDGGDIDPVAACRGSQLVLLATGVGAIIDLLEKIGPLLPTDVLITDVGSTKTEIVARARAVFGNAVGERFVGGHPMAGKEHSGVHHATADLFQNAAWILTPTPGQNLLAERCNALVVLLETIGARILLMDPATQDRLCAWVSHVPQFMATALAATLVEEFSAAAPDDTEAATLNDVQAVGGRALREMTRIASSPYSMWRDIALTNATNIEAALLHLEQRLAHLRENLRSPELRAEFERANSFTTKTQRHEDE
jgi:prephenate dehydrogenase